MCSSCSALFFKKASLDFHVVGTLAITFQINSEQYVRNTRVVMNAHSFAFPSMKNECHIAGVVIYQI